MQGPQALASTVAPRASKSSMSPSRTMVERICSEPGVTSSRVRALNPLPAASRAMDAARVMSSYDELVQLPMSAALISSGQPLWRASSPRSVTSRARSGVWGPLMWGPSASRSISTTRS